MSRVTHWLQQREWRIFFWINHRIQHVILDFILSRITHLGGAAFTILTTIGTALFAGMPWRLAGTQSLIALAVSHVPVAVLKRKYPRLRPHLALPGTHTGRNPLTDHSFPSGHTTAIFAVVVPFVAALPMLGLALLPLAATVAISRIYLGLHYPSDCIAGGLIGTLAGFASVAFVG